MKTTLLLAALTLGGCAAQPARRVDLSPVSAGIATAQADASKARTDLTEAERLRARADAKDALVTEWISQHPGVLK